MPNTSFAKKLCKLLLLFIVICPTLASAKLKIASPYLNLGGYIQWYTVNDGYYFNIDRSNYIRRGRPQLVGGYKNFSYMIEYGFERDENWRNVWVNLQNKAVQLRIGQFRPYFNTTEDQPSQYIWFLERPLPFRPFSTLFRRGILFILKQPKWNIGINIFAPGVQAQKGIGPPYGSTQRLLIFPFKKPGKIIQLGIGNWFQNTGRNNQATYNAIPEATGFVPVHTVSTGVMNNVPYGNTLNFDGLFQYKRFASQIAWLYNITPRQNSSTLHFTGWYAEFSLFLTDNTFNHSDFGTFTTPIHTLFAPELVFRISGINLNDKEIHGGREFNTTVGMNFYWVNHFELGINFIHAIVSGSTTRRNGSDNIWLLKLQYLL